MATIGGMSDKDKDLYIKWLQERFRRKQEWTVRRAALKSLAAAHPQQFQQLMNTITPTQAKSTSSSSTSYPVRLPVRSLLLIGEALGRLKPDGVVLRLLEKIGRAEERGPDEEGFYKMALETQEKILISEAMQRLPYNIEPGEDSERFEGGSGI